MEQVADKLEPVLQRYDQLVYRPITGWFQKFGPEFHERGHATTALQAFFLGGAFGVGLGLFYLSEEWNGFGLYATLLALFHFLEYVITAINNPDQLTGHCLPSLFPLSSLSFTLPSPSDVSPLL